MAGAPVLAGVGVALVTLFDDDGEIDAPATAGHARRVVDEGAAGVLVAGTTGEAFTLTQEERVELLDAVRAEVGGEVPVLAGTGAPSIRQAVSLTADAVAHGADVVLALSPDGAREVAPYYEAVVAIAGSVPVLAYHYPAASAPGIAVEDLAGLPVVGIKDSSGDPERLLRERTEWDREVYPGAASCILLAGALGCPGVILALANLEPRGCVAAFAGDADAQLALVAPHLASRPSPRQLKVLLAERFGTSPVCRVP